MVIDTLAGKMYKKCGLCGRIRNLLYRLTVRDAKTGQMVVGSLYLCEDCGNNLGDIIGSDVKPAKPRGRTVTF